jgi:hypothetical protein
MSTSGKRGVGIVLVGGVLVVLGMAGGAKEPTAPMQAARGEDHATAMNKRENAAFDSDELRQLEALYYKRGTPVEHAPFLLPGRELRIVMTVGGGVPRSAFERIALRVGDQIAYVDSPEKLAGHVLVDSPEKALAYARLFTSPATVRCVGEPWWLEVVPSASFDERFVFGRGEFLDFAPSLWLGRFREYGVLAESEWSAEGLSRPAVLRSIDGFIIVRLLFQPHDERKQSWWTDTAYWVAERVSRDGHIKRSVLGAVRLGTVELQLYPEK